MTDQEQEKKRRNNRTTGIILIVLGVIGLSLRFVFNRNDNTEWRTVDIIKLVVSVLIIIYGAYTIYKNRGKA
jgi:nitrate reductase gamma subunit